MANSLNNNPNNATQPPNPPVTPADVLRVLEALTCGAVREEHGMLRWSSNYTFLVSVENEDLRCMAVYKPQRGERPLWDFPDGTLCYREVASFVVSDFLGWQIVPPTVLREGTRGVGSIQFYIENNPDVNYFSLDQKAVPQLQRMAAFDYVINNADRKGGHVLLDPNGHIWGIDHGIAFNAVPKLRTVIWDFAGQRIPDAVLTDLERLCGEIDSVKSKLRMQVDKLLADAEVAAFQVRIRRLLQRREYPRPGPGPNYPWPPV
jgi:uncharacterized repeat protein (TIGR03843 family)